MLSRMNILSKLIAILCFVFPVSALAFTDQDVTNGDLHGTLTLPDGDGTASAVLILPGSGPVDRNGNLPGAENNSLKLVAEGLAAQGIASLRVDKRGIGGSRNGAVDESTLRFETYVADAASWLAVLQSQPRVTRIFLLGHSEGALVATMVAERAPVAGLMLIAGAGVPAAQIFERQLAEAGVSADLQAASRKIAADLIGGQTVADIPPPLAPLYRPSVQPYLISWFALDPAAELKKVDCPVLILQGTTDLQVVAADAQSLAAAQPKAKLVLIDGMNHVLKDAPADRAANLQTYAMPALPLAPQLIPTIVTFVAAP
jgi:pimeloyl-ACP methyl ester carboxylesterase